MQVGQLLNTDILPLNGKQTISAALDCMEELQADCMPVVDSTTKKLTGQLRAKQLRRAKQQEAAIASLELEEPVKVFMRQHIFEAARLMLQYELQLIPAVDEEITFVGVLTRQRLLEALPNLLNLDSNGAILTIEMDKIDFMLSEIVHHIEVEGAKILGLAVGKPESEGDPFQVSVKLNLKDATRVISSLRRHDYNVIVDDASRDVFGFDMENRADELLKYIDM